MIRIRVVKRPPPAVWAYPLITAGAVVLSLAASAGLLALQDKPPLAGMAALFQGAFGSLYAIEDCLIKGVPIYLCSLGVAVAFRLQVWNIGAEGQFALGAVGASWVVMTFPGLPAWAMIPAMIAAAMTAGGLWGFIPAVLKLRLRANEIIVTLMLNYIAILFLQHLVYGVWKDPASFGFPMTPLFPDAGIIGHIGATSLNKGIYICVLAGIAVWIVFRFTRMGYELKASGENLMAARYARFPYALLVTVSLILSGALAGLAGCVEASATLNRLQPSIIVGYGYTAIVVAWLARLHPLGIGFAAFLLAALRVGVENLQIELQVPAAVGEIMEGLILLTVLAGGFFHQYRFRTRRRA